MTGEEMFPVVNEKGELLKLAPRSVCHDGKSMLLHPVIHLHIINGKGHIFLQKRSIKKDIQPGKWDTSVGGHVNPGETPEQALVREAWEEAGLKNFSYEFIRKYIWESDRERELVYSYFSRTERQPAADTEEIDEGRFWTREEIGKNLGQGIFTPNFEHEFLQVLKDSSL
ncbi:MAG: NUDIX domain-containing protein [Bacteroidota bacterium]|nr:NUDIX domain-containing protein [Bacteroidota bacterium]